MKINREELVRRHNPVLHAVDTTSPLSVGNGELAFTADITGMQTFYKSYQKASMPLCTMSQWGWHTTPVSAEQYAYSRENLIETAYDFQGREVHYPIQCKEGNEEVYHWLRQNPHRLNLARIGLVWRTENTEAGFDEMQPEETTDISQILHMEQGILESRFSVKGHQFFVKTCCAMDSDTLEFSIDSETFEKETVAILLAFPYGSPDISGSDWESQNRHHTQMCESKDCAQQQINHHLKRTLDKDQYDVYIKANQECRLVESKENCFLLIPEGRDKIFSFTIHFSVEEIKDLNKAYRLPEDVENNAKDGWKQFWQKSGVVELHHSKDKRADELERRIILSQYLLAINSSGSIPPQETGLTCNSWYGKFHLEMYFWHEAYLPLWGRDDLLEKSLQWFIDHLKEARENASKNGYIGARWPKMVAEDGKDSPSPIAPLLLWQQPHIIYMINLMFRQNQDIDFLRKYEILIRETADFMADIAKKNQEGFYELLSPVIPVQECHAPEIAKNPTFEVEYWVFTLQMAIEMEEIMGNQVDAIWGDVASHMISSPSQDDYYLAHSNCPDTYEKYHIDHPSMLMAYGVIDSGRMNKSYMEKSLDKVQQVWDEQSLWGWDFAVMAMTATMLQKPDLAIDLLLKDTWKNMYVTSGNNRQESRDDLPLYLPGNGSLLLAVAMMTAGYDSCKEDCPGFPKDGNWTVNYEGIYPLPY